MKIVVIYIVLFLIPFFVDGQSSLHPGNIISGDTLLVKEWLRQSDALIKSNPSASKLIAEKALRLSTKLNFADGVAMCNFRMGKNALASKNYTNAIEYFQQAKLLLEEQGNEYYHGQALKGIADAYRASSFVRNAFPFYRDAAILLRKTGQMKLLNDCQEALGDIVVDFGQPANAVNFYKRSLIVKNNLHDQEGVIKTTAKISSVYLSLKQFDSALYYNKELQKLAKNNRSILESAAIEEMNIYSFQGKIAEADNARKNAEEFIFQSGNHTNRIKLLAATSGFYLAQKDKDMAAKYFDSAAKMIDSIKSPELAAQGLSLLAEMSSQQGDFKTAYRMAKMAEHYKDKFRNENVELISAELKNEAEAGLREKEIEYLGLVNKYKEQQLSKEELKRLALLRENVLKDSSIANQELLMEALQKESELRNSQLNKEKELSLSLSRENELKQKMLNDERRNKNALWFGLGAMTLLGGIIFYQFKKQQNKTRIINKQSAELEVLNKEIHHRVKNNLQVISSMLDLQSQSLNDEKATAIIKEGIQRVQSMAFIHQNLYQGNVVNSVNMNEYIKMLSNHLFQTYNIQTDRIKLHSQIEELKLHTDTAIPLGMILNELISNSLKYAFPKEEVHTAKNNGYIWIKMEKNGSELLLQVKDNGIGLPGDFDIDKTTSFGYEIIKAFSQKLKARIKIDGSSGTDVQIIISKFKTIENI